MKVDPDRPDQSRSISAVNDAALQVFTQWMVDQVDDDLDLETTVIPSLHPAQLVPERGGSDLHPLAVAPGRLLVDYWSWTRRPDPDEFMLATGNRSRRSPISSRPSPPAAATSV
jgi:hypothetical protein